MHLMPTARAIRNAAFEVVVRANGAYLLRSADARVVAQLPRLEAVVLKLRDVHGPEGMREILESITPAAESIVARVRHRFDALFAPERGIAVNLPLEQLFNLDERPGF